MTSYSPELGQKERAGFSPIATQFLLGELDGDKLQGALWDRVVPRFKMENSISGNFLKIDENFRRLGATLEADRWTPGMSPTEIKFTMSTDTYALYEEAKAISWSNKDVDTSLLGENLPPAKLAQLAWWVKAQMERDYVTAITNATFFSNNTTLTTAYQWDNFGSALSNPKGVMRSAGLSIFQKTGGAVQGKYAIFPYEVWIYLKDHPQVINDPKALTMISEYEGYLWGWHYYVPWGNYFSGAEEATFSSYTSIWGKTCIFYAQDYTTMSGTNIEAFIGPVAMLWNDYAGPELVQLKKAQWDDDKEWWKRNCHIRPHQFKRIHAGSCYLVINAVS